VRRHHDRFDRYASSRRSPVVRHRPRRLESARLTQESEERRCDRNRLIKIPDRISERRPHALAVFAFCADCCTALRSLMALSVALRRRSDRSLSGVKRTSTEAASKRGWASHNRREQAKDAPRPHQLDQGEWRSAAVAFTVLGTNGKRTLERRKGILPLRLGLPERVLEFGRMQ
jgi:hypothetical protein